MYLLDTNLVSELRRARTGRAEPRVIAWAERQPVAALFLSAVTLFELELGVLLAGRRDAAQGRALRAWLDGQVLPAFTGRILPVDAAVAIRAAALHVPDPASERDALIAATALVHGFRVVTRNSGDFLRTGVGLVNPWTDEADDPSPHPAAGAP